MRAATSRLIHTDFDLPRYNANARRQDVPGRSGACELVTDVVESLHHHRIEGFVAGEVDTLGNGDPVIPGAFAPRQRVDAEEVANDR